MRSKWQVNRWFRLLLLGVFCIILFGYTAVISSEKEDTSKKVDKSKYYVGIEDRGIKLLVGTQVAELVRTEDLLAIQVGVRNSSGKRVEVSKYDFKLLDKHGKEIEMASAPEVDNARKQFNNRLRLYTRVDAQLGSMYPKLPTDFYPPTGKIKFPTVTLPSNYKMVDFLYFKDSLLNGPYTLIWNSQDFEEPFTVDFDFKS